MSNLTDFLGGGGGGGLTPKFQEFNSSGTFTPSQALIDAGGYIEVFLVAGGGAGNNADYGGVGGEVFIKSMYLTSTSNISVTIGAGGSGAAGNNSVFSGSSAGGVNLTAQGGGQSTQNNQLGAGFGGYYNQNTGYNQSAAGSGAFGYGAGGAPSSLTLAGVNTAKANSGQGAKSGGTGGSGYCLVKWYE